MTRILTALVLGLALGMPAWASDMDHMSMSHGSKNPGAMSTSLSQGVVKKVNKAQHKLTIRHGPLANLDMPAMTMIFRVKNPAWLDQVKAGESIRFRAEMVNGQLTVTQLDLVH
jgi:Cu(I)/Ag(I) efflux system protein CusF